MGLDPLTIGFLTVTAVGKATEVVQTNRANKQNREAQRIDRASQQVEDARRRRAAARQARIQRAKIAQSSVNSGVAGSSGQIGAEGVISNQQATDQGYLFGSQVTADALSSRFQRAADYQMRAGIASAIGDLSLTVAGAISKVPKPVTPEE